MKMEKVSTYLTADTEAQTFILPLILAAIKKEDTGCGLRGAGRMIAEGREQGAEGMGLRAGSMGQMAWGMAPRAEGMV